MTETAPAPPSPAGPQARWLKLWVVAHVGLTTMAVPALLGLVGYGLVHANDRAAGGFLLMLLAAAGVVIAAPLSLLSPRKGPQFILLKAVGWVALMAGTGGALLLLGYSVLQPQWLGWRFERAMSGLRVASVKESPVLLDGQPSGLRVVAELEVPQPVQLDRQGMATVDLMQSLHLQVRQRVPGVNLPSPFDSQGPSQRRPQRHAARGALSHRARVLVRGPGRGFCGAGRPNA
jgi:hypothetical protein